MNMLTGIDSTLHYENIERIWNKYKVIFIIALLAIFAVTAAYNLHTTKKVGNAETDSIIVFSTILENSGKDNYTEILKNAIENVTSVNAKETLTLELAKAYKKANNTAEYEKTLTGLTTAKTSTIRDMSTFMLAENFLNVDAKLAVEFIDNASIKASSFTYLALQELKAMALVKLEKKEEAKKVFDSILKANPSPALKQSVEFKVKQIS